MLILAVSLGLPAFAQQGGVTILRGQGSDQPAPTTPDTGVRRVPTDRNVAVIASLHNATPTWWVANRYSMKLN